MLNVPIQTAVSNVSSPPVRTVETGLDESCLGKTVEGDPIPCLPSVVSGWWYQDHNASERRRSLLEKVQGIPRQIRQN